MGSKLIVECSFCHSDLDMVNKMFSANQFGVYVCDLCIRKMYDKIGEEPLDDITEKTSRDEA